MKVLLTMLFIIMTHVYLIASLTSIVQDSTKEITCSISGSIDAYYRANINADFEQVPSTAFGNLSGFALGMANIVLSHNTEKYGMTADLVFGPRGEDATFLSADLRPGGSSNIINQLFVYYQVTDRIKATLGNFNTFLGYEVISPTANFNYSTSYMFSYGPFSHTGFKLDFDLGSGFSLMSGVFNPTDATEYNPTNEFSAGLQLGYENQSSGVWFNSLYSKYYYQFDITSGINISEKIYLGLNATKAKDAFQGVATYVQYSSSEKLKLGTRLEYFEDKGVNVEMIGSEEKVTAVTISAQYVVGQLTLIPEIRTDLFSTDSVQKNAEYTNNLASVLLAAVYDF